MVCKSFNVNIICKMRPGVFEGKICVWDLKFIKKIDNSIENTSLKYTLIQSYTMPRTIFGVVKYLPPNLSNF